MSMTPLPTPPSRSDPSNFAERGDAFLGALPVFATEANALETNVNNKEASATASAGNAALSATAAQSAANAAAGSVNATAWNAATNYSLDVRVISPTTRGMFRRIVAGTSATDPALDATNWAPFITAVINGGTGAATAGGARVNLGAAAVNAPIFTGTTLELRAALDSLMVGYSTGRNRIANGDMTVVQAAAASSSSATYGGPDRYSFGFTGPGAFTQSSSGFSFGGRSIYSCRHTVNTPNSNFSGGNFWSGIMQRIEGYEAADLPGDKIGVSFIFNTNVTGQYSVSLTDSNASNSWVGTFNAVANTPVQVALVTPVMPAGALVPGSNALGMTLLIGFLNAGSIQAPSTNTWLSGNYSAAAGNVNWAAAANNFIEISAVQVERGLCTTFERVSAALNTIRCFRHYQSGAFFRTLYGGTSMVSTEVVFFPTAMRATPTMTPNATYANGSNFLFNNISSSYFFTNWTITSQGSATINGSFVADARL